MHVAMPGLKSQRISQRQDQVVVETLNPEGQQRFWRPPSFRMTCLKANLRRRTLEEFPMDHNWADVARMSARRRQEKDASKQRLVSTCGQSNQLKSYSRRRFETALNVGGKSLPPPSPEDKSIFWDEVKPTWTHRRHHSAVEHHNLITPSSELINTRPVSEPPRSTLARIHKGSDGVCRFNHLRGNNAMYPSIKRLLQESNQEYRVVSATPNISQESRFNRRPSVDHSDVTECYLIPREKDPPEEINHEVNPKERQMSNVQQNTLEDDRSEYVDSVDGSAEDIGDVKRMDVVTPPHKVTQLKNDDDDDIEEEKEEDNDEPSPPWRCWVDDATVSSIDPDPETLNPSDEVTTPSASLGPPAEETSQEISILPADAAVDTAVSKGRLSVPGKLSRASSASLDKRESGTSPAPEVSVGKRTSSARLKKKKKGRKGTPETSPVEVVELPPPPPPPPATPPMVEIVEEEPKEAEEEVELILPSYICPSSIAKSTEVEIKLWLRKSSFTGANRTVPILF